MSTRVSADLVRSVIRAQPVDCLSAEDLNDGARIGYASGSSDQLCSALDELQATVHVPYRVRIWNQEALKKKGAKATEEKPFEFIVQPTPAYLQGAPLRGSDPPTSPEKGPTWDYLLEAARSTAEAQVMRDELDRMRRELDELRNAEPLNEAPAPLRWWESEQGGAMIGEALKSIGSAVAALLKHGNYQFVKGHGGIMPAPPLPGPDDNEAKLIAAFRAMNAADPEFAKQVADQLLSTYGEQSAPVDKEGSEG